jgi:hypothetical protein
MRYVHSLAATLTLATAISAAPLGENALSDKYLPDDADAVVVVNVKQLLGSELYTKHYKKLVDDFLTSGPAAPLLKELGVDPLKDVDRIYGIATRSSYKLSTEFKEEGPVALLEGRFDAGKLVAAAEKAAKEHPAILKLHVQGDARIVEYTPPSNTPAGPAGYAVVLDRNHVFFSPRRADVDAALEKAAAKKKTALANKTFASLFRKLNDSDSLGVAASGDAKTNKVVIIPMDKPPEPKIATVSDLGGVQTMLISIRVESEATIKSALAFKDKDAAVKMDKTIEEGLKLAVQNLEKSKEFAALVKALKGVKTSVKGEVVTVEGKADAETLQQYVLGVLLPRPIGPPRFEEKKPVDK